MPKLLDRQALLSDIDKEIELFSSSAGNHDYFDYAKKNGLVIAKQIVGRQPTIEAEQVMDLSEPVKHMQWEEDYSIFFKKYCEACGARMDGDADNG